MKVRFGFVSNSSSSSFLCDVCGDMQSGMDANLSDMDMSSCENGHTYCNAHANELTLEQKREWLISTAANDVKAEECKMADEEEIEEMIDENSYDFADSKPASNCPCCTLKSITDEDLINYMLHERKQNKKQVEEEIRSKYKNHDSLKNIKIE